MKLTKIIAGLFYRLLARIKEHATREFLCDTCNTLIPGEQTDFYLPKAFFDIPLICGRCLGTGRYKREDEFRSMQILARNIRAKVCEIRYMTRGNPLDKSQEECLKDYREHIIDIMKKAGKVIRFPKQGCLASKYW